MTDRRSSASGLTREAENIVYKHVKFEEWETLMPVKEFAILGQELERIKFDIEKALTAKDLELAEKDAEIERLNTECALKARALCKFVNKNLLIAESVTSLEAELQAHKDAIKVARDEELVAKDRVIAEKDAEIRRLSKLADKCEPMTKNGEPLQTHIERIKELEDVLRDILTKLNELIGE